jgi:hypothetical protein
VPHAGGEALYYSWLISAILPFLFRPNSDFLLSYAFSTLPSPLTNSVVSYGYPQRRILVTNDTPQYAPQSPSNFPPKPGSCFELLAREDLHYSAADNKIQRLSPQGNDLRLSDLTRKKPEFQAAKVRRTSCQVPAVRLLIKSV